MDEKTARTAVTALVGEGLLPASSMARALDVLTRPAAPGRGRARLAEVAAWFGAALVLAAAGLFLAEGWNDLTAGQQAVALGGIAVVLAASGLAVRQLLVRRPGGALTADAARRLGSVLLSGAAVGACFAVALGVDAADGVSYGDWPGVAGALALVLTGAAAYRLVPSAFGQLVVVAGVFALVPYSLELGHGGVGVWMGIVELLLAVGWLVLAELGAFRERLVATALGSGWALLGAQLALIDGDHASLGYLLTALVAVAGFAEYVRTLRWPYVGAAVVAVTLVVPEAVTDWTDGSVGPAGAVLLAGLAMLAAAFAGLRIRKEHGVQA